MVPEDNFSLSFCDSSYHGRTCDEGEEGIGRWLAGGPSDSGSRSSQCLTDTYSQLQEVQEEDLSHNARGRGEALPRIL